MGKLYLSKDGYEKLKKELEYLKKPEVSARIKIAREHGDLRENSEYDTAKEVLTQVMIRIRDISMKLSNAELIEDADIDPDKAYIGATVYLKDIDSDEDIKYMLVCADEADPMEDKISVDSPIGQGLLGHKAGDTVEIIVPRGTLKYKITKIGRE